MQTFTYQPITTHEIGHTDLQREVGGKPCECYVITIYDAAGINAHAEAAEAVYLPGEGRLGIAWGGDATWADVDDVESGIEMWLNDGEAWELAN